MTGTILFLGLRALHVLVAGIWIGSTTFLAVVLIPAIDASGPAGGQVMTRLSTRNTAYMTSLAAATILSGIYLLWRFTGGFDGSVLATHAGRAFSTGGAAGILAGIVGAIVGRTAGTLVETGGALAKAPDDAARQALGRQNGPAACAHGHTREDRDRAAGDRPRPHGVGALHLNYPRS